MCPAIVGPMSATLIASQEHPVDLLALYTEESGVLKDAYEVKYRVFDASASLPGTQIEPVSGWTTVTTGVGHIGTGRYGVDKAGSPWTPSSTYARAYVEWYYKMSDTGPVFRVFKFLEVVAASTTLWAGPAICLMQDVRDFDASVTISDKELLKGLRTWLEILERYARVDFIPRYSTVVMSGNGARALHLAKPLFAAGEILANNSSSPLDLANMIVTRDRGNPSLQFNAGDPNDVFNQSFSGQFKPGLHTSITGVWGDLDPNTQGPPEVVKEIAGVQGMAEVVSNTYEAGPVKMEMTDGHMVTYAVSATQVRSALMALLRTPAIRDALDLYRAPISLGAPANQPFSI